ncbi:MULTISPECIES: SDR family oxidoreductase [unclassified Achromobacter]|uniref:SDR family oxidoreductase n=1 Tax=unclassified Achromobacter TaxID=2626865 RepID=UPI000B51C732|nr:MULTISPECIES: SDR family oxidoreductase [unclassified Achromobacter]OWT77399.1 3-oxoacyl-ACP reductase [Achromobacter sp. HZ28]OWT78280.1 3-oxoacyl-ACP reductase [Achromobacter sp. HZ34]
MDLGLEDKTALVLGAGGGLGSAIAQALAREGARVALADIDDKAAAHAAAALDPARTLALPWDLADLDGIAGRLAAIREKLGHIDILINNTGGPAPSPVNGQPTATWRQRFESMVLPVIAITDAVLPAMRERRWGRIVTSTSSGVIAPIPNLGLSNSLRSTLVGWSKTLAREVAADGITANIVVPGRIATDRIRFLDEEKARRENKSVDDISRQSTAAIPVGRYGEPQEYADLVAFLASQRAAYITGSIVRVDGGLISSI